MLDSHNDTDINLVKHSYYYSEQQFIDIHSHREGLSIISLNIRSITVNYTDLELMIELMDENNHLSVIYLNGSLLEVYI